MQTLVRSSCGALCGINTFPCPHQQQQLPSQLTPATTPEHHDAFAASEEDVASSPSSSSPPAPPSVTSGAERTAEEEENVEECGEEEQQQQPQSAACCDREEDNNNNASLATNVAEDHDQDAVAAEEEQQQPTVPLPRRQADVIGRDGTRITVRVEHEEVSDDDGEQEEDEAIDSDEDHDVDMGEEDEREEMEMASADPEEEEEEEDTSGRSKATLVLTVDRVRDYYRTLNAHACNICSAAAVVRAGLIRRSKPASVRNLCWSLVLKPLLPAYYYHDDVVLQLQCRNPRRQQQQQATAWSCHAQTAFTVVTGVGDAAESRNLLGQDVPLDMRFSDRGEDFGCKISLGHFMDPDEDDSITFQVALEADAPHGLGWDSKRHTGYVGLKNQGATCYMNSLLETLFFSNQLRRAVYLMPTEGDDPAKSIPLALQRVFYELQHGDKAVSTKRLTESFGWETIDSFMQHDVQEMCRVLLDNVEDKMKGTCVEGTIPKLFGGKTVSYIQCKHVDYGSERIEDYYDIQLSIKGKKNLYESFKDYVATEQLDGDNKYDAGEHGLQEAEKGVKFLSFPPILHLQLMRFTYDPLTDQNQKINDRFEFPEQLCLDEFLREADPEDPADYVLHAVLVHSGDNHRGHYVVYLDPAGDGDWCKFDDDVVSRCSRERATEQNYGRDAARHCTSAYMLAYVRRSKLAEVLRPLTESDIPQQLVERLQEEMRAEEQRRKELEEAHLYMAVNVVTEEQFLGHQGGDLYDEQKVTYKEVLRLRRTSTPRELLPDLAQAMGLQPDQLRLWSMKKSGMGAKRPVLLSGAELDCTVLSLSEYHNGYYYYACHNASGKERNWTLFAETADREISDALPAFDASHDLALFLKLYDPRTAGMHYCGRAYVPRSGRVRDALLPLLCERAGFPQETALLVYKEVGRGQTEQLLDYDACLEAAVGCGGAAVILVFQKEEDSYKPAENEDDDGGRPWLPTAKDYFDDVRNRVEVVFCDKSDQAEPGVTLTFSKHAKQKQVVTMVARKLARGGGDAGDATMMLQFWRDSLASILPVRYAPEGPLADMLPQFGYGGTAEPHRPLKLYYQRLKLPIEGFEDRRICQVFWRDGRLGKEEEILLHPPRHGSVRDLLDECKKSVCLADDGHGSEKLRLLEITMNKINKVFGEDVQLDSLMPYSGSDSLHSSQWFSFRIEEIPCDQVELEPGAEKLVCVAHFHKHHIYNLFGAPFLLRLRQGEPFREVVPRIRSALPPDVRESDFERFKFAIIAFDRCVRCVTATPVDPDEYRVNLKDFEACRDLSNYRPWLGLEHADRTPKRNCYAIPERAIKIHN